MATAVEAALDELQQLRDKFDPEHEGLRDFARLNLAPETMASIKAVTVNYDRRVKLIDTARVALEALMADGHPDLPITEIDQRALDDLTQQATTIQAALARFAPNTATDMGLEHNVEPQA